MVTVERGPQTDLTVAEPELTLTPDVYSLCMTFTAVRVDYRRDGAAADRLSSAWV